MKKAFKKLFRFLLSFLICLVVFVTCIVTIQTFVAGSLNIEGPSMLPTIQEEGAIAYYVINGYTPDYDDIVIAYAPAEGKEQGVCPAEIKNTFSAFLNNYSDYLKNYFNLFKNKKNSVTEKETESGYVCVIKRVVGLPGDTVTITDGHLYVNGEEREEGFLGDEMVKKNTGESYGVKNGTWILEDDEYFILGDNRNISRDSEDYGPVKASHILGKVWMVKQKGKLTLAKGLK